MTVILPCVQPSAVTERLRKYPVPLAKEAGQEVSVLVVEDERAVRDAAVRILERSGFSVICASSGEEALSYLTDAAPAVVLTDVVMPGMSGAKLAECIRECHPATQVVFMSGYNEEVTVREGIARHEVRLVKKPFDADELTAAVATAAGG